MQMGCNIKCFVLSQVYSGVFCVEVSNTTDLQARGMFFIHDATVDLRNFRTDRPGAITQARVCCSALINTKVQTSVELLENISFIYGLMGEISCGVMSYIKLVAILILTKQDYYFIYRIDFLNSIICT